VLVEQLHHANDLLLGIEHRRGEDRPGLEAGQPVDLGIEARVGVGVGHVDDLAGGRRDAGEALADLHADLRQWADLVHQHTRPQLAALLVDQEDRAALGADSRDQLVEDQAQQVVELDVGRHHLADGAHGVEFLHHADPALAIRLALDALDQLEDVGLARLGGRLALDLVHQRVDEVQAHAALDAGFDRRVDVERLDVVRVQRQAPVGERDLHEVAVLVGGEQNVALVVVGIGVVDDIGRCLFDGQLQLEQRLVGQGQAVADPVDEMRDHAQVFMSGSNAQFS